MITEIIQNMLDNVFPIIISAAIAALFSMHLFHKQKDTEMAKQRLIKFYYPAYKILEKHLHKKYDDPDVQNALKELFELAGKKEFYAGEKTIDLIFRYKMACKIRNEDIETWIITHNYKTILNFSEEKSFKKLCLYICMTYRELTNIVGIPIKPIWCLKPREILWVIKRTIKICVGYFLTSILCVVLIGLIIWILKLCL